MSNRLTPEKFLKHLAERILVFDGAMGTNLQTQNLNLDHFGGAEGCNEALNLHFPQAIRRVHAEFLRAGCRAIETNTFGANRIVLKEYGLEDKTRQIIKAAVQVAREAVETVRGEDERFVAGSIGPTTRLPSLGQISFDDMSAAFLEQVEALWDAGVDIMLIETCQDLLQTKAVLAALIRHFRKVGKRCPVMVSVTLEAAGTTLVGSDVSAVQAILDPYDIVDVIGINCATGPLEMVRHVDFLSRFSGKPVSVMPNAGLPENVDGKAFYRLEPAGFADFLHDFVVKNGVSIVGGCCGTSAAHLQALVEKVGKLTPITRKPEIIPSASSMFSAVPLKQDPAPCLVGERTNANGSRKFRDLLLQGDWDTMTAMGKDQARGGAHLLDLCLAYVGRDERPDMEKLVPLFATQVKLPLVIDSTDPTAIEAALKRHAGRCVVNSVNFEDGGRRLKEVARLARDYGAALICLTIDEEGMARTAERKLAIAHRLFNTLTKDFGFRPADLIFDPLTFTLGSGDKDTGNAGRETLDALEMIKKDFPESFTILGVSNISFGLSPAPREVLNSVFLHEATKKGLGLAIVNPQGIIPYYKISEENRRLALDLLMNSGENNNALMTFLDAFKDASKAAPERPKDLPPAETLRLKVMDGEKTELEATLTKLRATVPPLEIINSILIPAMREVGELFGRGETQLPFVLQSAEVMKASVGFLEPHMEKKAPDPKKKIVLATVSGDVHDIGKNLVDILLTNNGFTVFNLGIKIDIDTMIKAAAKEQVSVIGMSGLLVKSTQVMKENLEELNRRGLSPIVILGGAALTRSFVEKTLIPLYKGTVYYAQDAFEGLKLMQQLTSDTPAAPVPEAKNTVAPIACVGSTETVELVEELPPQPAPSIPQAPRIGKLNFVDFKLADVLPLMNKKMLFRGRWQYRQGNLSDDAYKNLIEKFAEPAYNRMVTLANTENLLDLKGVYGIFNCRKRGNDLAIFGENGKEVFSFKFPRGRRKPHLCLSDYFYADRDDVIVLWATTIGDPASEKEGKIFQEGNYGEYWHWHGFSVEVAEGTADYLEKLYAKDMNLENRGLRYSYGYPACPYIEQQEPLLNILESKRIGLTLTETFQMVPEQSVSGIFIHHPQAKYFVP